MCFFTSIKSFFTTYLSWIFLLCLLPEFGFCQQVKNVPEAFSALAKSPVVYKIKNRLKVPIQGGHLQGVQWINNKGNTNLLISGSSATHSYMLEADLKQKRTVGLHTLMQKPYKHAGGIQVSQNYLIVGIEDNDAKTSSKVCLYDIPFRDPKNVIPSLTVMREGEAKIKTAGAVGLIGFKDGFLAVVSNWDSRNWDFYLMNPSSGTQEFIYGFKAPDDWGNYQSINLIRDKQSMYAIGFFGDTKTGYADLIYISPLNAFHPKLKKLSRKAFDSKRGVDFNTAAGIQVNNKGELIIWATQREAKKRIFINRFSQK